MRKRKVLYSGMLVALALLAASLTRVSAQQPAGAQVRIDNDDIGGVVTSSKGPEAGVWVIAETNDLETKFNKIVVTDDQGRYLVPDLPKANYKVWVRGYGLVDSQAVESTPGKVVNLTAVIAPNEKAAAEYYPASQWYALIHVPAKSEFPGTGASGNGISPTIKTQAQWIAGIKTDGCVGCHQLGNKATRTLSPALGTFPNSAAAWERRISSGQAGGDMIGRVVRLGKDRALGMLADWTDRIAAGELPPAPPRPQGEERNVVITQWDWAGPKEYFHDAVATDKRHPEVNSGGPIYGVHELSSNNLSILDPVRNVASEVKIPLRDVETPYAAPRRMAQPSVYWGDELIWDGKVNAHNPMIDQKGRVWLTSKIRPNDNPSFCKEGSDHPSAKLFPMKAAGRHVAMYDPKTKQFKLISTCFSTHHLYFAEDANNTLWTSGGGPVVGWINTKMYDETGDEVKSQGWAPFIVDTNGNGKQDAWVEWDQPADPAKDKRYPGGFYGVMPSPDGTVWGSQTGFPGGLIHLIPGSNPPNTALAEVYEVPWGDPKAPVQGFSPRGMDVDRNGVVWAPLASGHLASFDRRKCKGPLNGPDAMGKQCPEGWTLYPMPGPKMAGVDELGSTESSYYTWVDQFDTLGLGANTPMATGNQNGSIMALQNGKWVNMRVPYPLGFFAKGLDGRIDNPNTGWKGRGLWTTYGTRAPFHAEGGKGTLSKVIHFQMRPDPLAK
jgi:hypothetical protein